MFSVVLLINSLICFALTTVSCKKSNSTTPVTGTTTDTSVKPQTDPATAATIGFFLDDWQPRTFTVPTTTQSTSIPPSTGFTVTVDRSTVITKIPRSIAGANSNSWMGQMVTEASLLNYLQNLDPHIIRFPGGSISDIYFWNATNAAPSDAPANLVNADGTTAAAGYWFGKNTGSWTLSLDNYYAMLQTTGSQGIITINYGYARYGTSADPVAAAAHLAADWVRYDNGRTKYWEIGNENYGNWEAGYRIDLANNHDGQPTFISAALYGQHFKVFADSMRKAATAIGKAIYIGAVSSESGTTSSTLQNGWNQGMMTASNTTPDFYVVHNYYTPYNANSTSAEILATPQPVNASTINYVKQSLTTVGLSAKPVVHDEWNMFATGNKQAVSNVSGLFADLIIGESIKNQYGMTNRWDLANAWDNGNDHGMFNNGDEPGIPKWNPRPSFYHQYFFHQYSGDRMVSATSSAADLFAYGTSFSSGETGVILINTSTNDRAVEIQFQNFKMGNRYYWYTLTGGSGEFSGQTYINGTAPTNAAGGPLNYTTITPYAAATANGIKVYVPARGAVYLMADRK
ncbi:MAG: alpha-L-arabinofuranosidase [Bacteroidetes bacterium]|nr:alpha-L-arabinofuranosidase [Bacteroidota bacterium]